VIQWAQRLGWGEIWHRKEELAQEQMQSWRLRGRKRKKMVCAQGKKIGSEYQMIWTGLLDTNGQDRSATRHPEGGSEMHSLIYFLLV
jgi:hypothetical protein